MTGSHALTVLANWLEARQDYERLSALRFDAPEPELSDAALRVLRTFSELERLSSRDVRRWATDLAKSTVVMEGRRVGQSARSAQMARDLGIDVTAAKQSGLGLGLPALLSELAMLLPERVRVEPPENGYWFQARVSDDWRAAWTPGEVVPEFLLSLEAALREECEARGWPFWQRRTANGTCWATVYPIRGREYESGDFGAPTPAEALATAVLAALRTD